MLERILLAVDGSDHARRASDLAGDLAAKYGARLLIAHVLVYRRLPEPVRRMAEIEHLVEPESGRVVPTSYISLPSEADQDMRIIAALGEKILNDAEYRVREKGAGEVEKVPLEGEPADALLAEIRRRNVDLAVVGTRGLGELSALLLGSVSHKLLQLAPCPVLAVK